MRIQGMKYSVLIAAGLLIYSLPGFNASKVDKTIIREVDLTRDGVPEKIVFHVTGDNMRSPFSWTVEIFSGGQQIYRQENHDDAGYDSLFNLDDDFWNDAIDCACYNYESCKKRWYFDYVPTRFLVRLDVDDSEWLDKTKTAEDPNPFHPYSEIYDRILKTGKATALEAKNIVENLKRHVESGDAFGVDMEIIPNAGGLIAVWIPVIDDFFVIFEPS